MSIIDEIISEVMENCNFCENLKANNETTFHSTVKFLENGGEIRTCALCRDKGGKQVSELGRKLLRLIASELYVEYLDIEHIEMSNSSSIPVQVRLE